MNGHQVFSVYAVAYRNMVQKYSEAGIAVPRLNEWDDLSGLEQGVFEEMARLLEHIEDGNEEEEEEYP